MKKILSYTLDFLGFALLIIAIALPVGIVINLNPSNNNSPASVLGASNSNDQLIQIEFGQLFSNNSIEVIKNNTSGRDIEMEYKIKNNIPEMITVGSIINTTEKEVNLNIETNGQILLEDITQLEKDSIFTLKPSQKVTLYLKTEDEVDNDSLKFLNVNAAYH